MKEGLYEQVINLKIQNEIEKAKENDYKIDTKNIEEAEAPQILSKYIAEVIKKGLNQVNSKSFASQIHIANKIVSLIEESTGDEEYRCYKLNEEDTAEQLLSVLNKKRNNTLKEKSLIRPETSVAFSYLFTGGSYEPNMMGELKKEIRSADRIDMLVSFIKWSGLRLILDELKDFTARGGKLRVITTSYMGATDVRAVEELKKLQNTEIKISYDTKRIRLHAKAYIFYRNTGFTTAYVGSSNLSNAAISSGLEWNMKVTKKELPEILDKINMTFESYWESTEFSEYKKEDALKLQRVLNAEKYQDNNSVNDDYGFDVYPYPYQQEILDKLKAEREIHNRFKNLVVAATGTGKTVISAFDYRNFKRENKGKPCRLLFLAHREEIVKQSLNTFRGILHDGNFGELFVGNYKPDKLDYVFASIQSINSAKLTEITESSYYDFIIVDEFHHAAADSYQNVLAYYKPKILLGLTATPERMDGKSILEYFDNTIAAEIRLPEAVNRKLLCPFQYFGVADSVDYSELKWSRGGYDKTELSNILTGNDARVHLIINKLRQYVSDINEVIGIGFCVSKAHAAYMAEKFNEAGIPSMALTSDSSRDERENAKNMLVSGKIKFIFTVDLYNEGVDIPAVNTVLFLRPTESRTVFLQQLGRGLRLYEGKDCLTVLDFVGQSNKKYNFEQKFAALLTKSEKSIKDEIENEFTSLPKGCYIELEKQASQYILDNIKEAVKGKSSIISKMKTFEEDTGLDLNLFRKTFYLSL